MLDSMLAQYADPNDFDNFRLIGQIAVLLGVFYAYGRWRDRNK